MSSTLRRDKLVLLVFGTGAITGLHLGLLHLALSRSWTAPVTFVAGSVVLSAVTWALWRWIFPNLRGRSFLGQVARELAAALVISTVASASFAAGVAWLSGAPGLFAPPSGETHTLTITPEMRQSLVRLYALLPVVPTVLMSVLAYHLVWLHVQDLRSRARELRELAATAQLAALRAQINPHFLFNSLNSIAQLIRVDPDKAETCVERLAEIFRYVLSRAEQEFVPLSEELQMTRAYLDIERARFDERLRVETTIDPQSLRQPIPNLILQPLVENALKHGLSRKLGPGTVSITAQVRGDRLELEVGDDGLGMTAPMLDEVWRRGVGLRNLRQRLERLYGPEHLPRIESEPGRGTIVRITLPVMGAEAA